MIKFRVRRLLKFRNPGVVTTPKGAKRQALKRHLSVPAKFAKVFQLTAAAYNAAVKIEKREGHLPQGTLQNMILQWARDLLGIMSMDVEIKGAPPEMTTPVLFVGNHVSYVDIPLLMASVPVVFVAKEEVSKWLVIGQASKKAGTVFVKRESGQSRANAADAIVDTILRRRQSIGIFPSGTTCTTEDKPWRHGAFKIAQKHQIPVQPFRIRYEPLRKVAYVGKDTFATHLLGLLRLERVKAVIEFDSVRHINDATSDCNTIRDWTRELFRDMPEHHET
jgi:1-acyl-sn-glycerol-3-phosphate acyltransferase